MTKRATQKRIALLSVISVAALALVACGPMGEETPQPGVGSSAQGIKMPPLSSMKINFNVLARAKQNATIKTRLGQKTGSGFAYKHVSNAIVRSGAAGVVVGLGLAPYVTIYGALLNSGFTFDGKAFHAQTTVAGIPVSAVGTPNLLKGELAIEITRDGKLYTTGTSDLTATSGSWTLHSRHTGFASVRVDWSASTAGGVNVAGEVVDTTHKNVGTTASINFDTAGVITLSYDVKPGNGATTVTYDSATKLGSLEAADYNGGFAGCWDASFRDTACQ